MRVLNSSSVVLGTLMYVFKYLWVQTPWSVRKKKEGRAMRISFSSTLHPAGREATCNTYCLALARIIGKRQALFITPPLSTIFSGEAMRICGEEAENREQAPTQPNPVHAP